MIFNLLYYAWTMGRSPDHEDIIRLAASFVRSVEGPILSPAIVEQRRRLAGLLIPVIEEYRLQPTTRDRVTRAWQSIWAIWGQDGEISPEVPDCDLSDEELAELGDHGLMIIYVPPELATQDTRHLLGSMFPFIQQSSSVRLGNTVRNIADLSGWVDVESSVEPPYPNITEAQLREKLDIEGRVPLTVNAYFVGSLFSKLMMGQYFDSESFSRLLGSEADGYPVYGCYSGASDNIGIVWNWPEYDHSASSLVGGRTGGIK